MNITISIVTFHVNLATLAVERDLPTPVERGVELAESGAVERLDADTFAVAGSNGTAYTVQLGAGPASCTCPDHQYRQRDCKHIVAARVFVAAEPTPVDEAFVPAPGVECIARLRGEDVRVKLGARNPRTKMGRGFYARRMDTGREITIPSPGCLRPIPTASSPAPAAPPPPVVAPGLGAPAIVPDLENRPLGYICRSRRHGSTVTRTVPGTCSMCRVPMAPVYATSRDAFRFPPRRCFACGEQHAPNADC